MDRSFQLATFFLNPQYTHRRRVSILPLYFDRQQDCFGEPNKHQRICAAALLMGEVIQYHLNH